MVLRQEEALYIRDACGWMGRVQVFKGRARARTESRLEWRVGELRDGEWVVGNGSREPGTGDMGGPGWWAEREGECSLRRWVSPAVIRKQSGRGEARRGTAQCDTAGSRRA